MARCELCKQVYWKPTSTGLCSRAYCKLTDNLTPINPYAEHSDHQVKCKNFSNANAKYEGTV